MNATLTKSNQSEWDRLLECIASDKCAPFLGAGACYGALPLGKDMARELSLEYDYSNSVDNLQEVSQFIAIKTDPLYPKELVIKRWFHKTKPPDFSQSGEIHSVLACLPLSLKLRQLHDCCTSIPRKRTCSGISQMVYTSYRYFPCIQ